MPRVQEVPSGTLGFDCNAPVTMGQALQLRDLGYHFAIRYVGREVLATNDLSTAEVQILHHVGLAVGVVQHVQSAESWTPTVTKGRTWGFNAARFAAQVGMPSHTTIWCDLEGVSRASIPSEIIAYCNYWHDQVANAGFQPGLYVGWRSGLSASELYRRLKFTRYWAAYNLNVDERPEIRGVCMQQKLQKQVGSLMLDPNQVHSDMLGGLPSVFAPDEWSPA